MIVVETGEIEGRRHAFEYDAADGKNCLGKVALNRT
jgi:hypothetical protein